MRLLRNSGTDRALDLLREWITPGARIDPVSSTFSLLAFAELKDALERADRCRMVLGEPNAIATSLLGGDADIAFRGQLQGRWLARAAVEWAGKKADIRNARKAPPQPLIYVRGNPSPGKAMMGSCSFTTEGPGLTPGGLLGLVQATGVDAEAASYADWFESNSNDLRAESGAKASLITALEDMASQRAPSLVYFQTLCQMFKDLGDELDEERIVKSATGIRDTVVWKKLFRFQRDGVTGAIDKLERIGGCIIADSVGLGKTFEALAVIKCCELRNDRALALCPKRLRDNWTLYKVNDRRNVLAPDRLHYGALNHTDLSRDGGLSGDIDLSHVNWGNYGLVVIDESHNFRNKPAHKDRDARYDRLMKRIIQSGVKTKVLMLPATPVNNRLAGLKNQIAFVTEGHDVALARRHGIASIGATIRKAQFALTVVERQLKDVEALLAKIDAHGDSVEETPVDDIDVDDPAFEALLVGRKVKVLLQDVDRVRWRQDLVEDRDRLSALLSAARLVTPERDAKLAALKKIIVDKVSAPINPDNRKILLFTAFADTADYLYRDIAAWARDTLGVHCAAVSGTGSNRTAMPGVRGDMSGILSAFSPRSKERPADFRPATR